MARRLPIIMLAILILVILQAGFFSRFAFFSNRWIEFINPTVVFVLIYSLFEHRHRRLSFIFAGWSGILLDFYSENFFGLWTFSLLFLVLLVKIIKRYVSIPAFW